MLSNVFTVMGLATVASAHIIMTNPVPYGTFENSPLDASGSNFPCQNVANPGGKAGNTYEAGSTQELAFEGTAVHGGGSCQVSVTTDLNPTKDSTWKVIKSIEGGCPARDQAGNLPGSNAAATDPYTYEFQIPDEMPSGDYVLAWSWFNKIGNREMYMNCASVEITGGSDDDSFLDTLPDMFVANIGNECSTADSKDLQFPDPGQYLAQENGATTAWGAPIGSNCGASGSTPTASDAQPTQTSEPTTTADVQPSTTAAVSISVGSGSSHTAGSACSSEGTWDCIGGSSYQRCASGVWSEVMQMAGGTTCVAGESSELSVAAAVRRRAVPLRV
ncbi:Chitin binding domain [Geosmithia morbida]|uniref:Chitin binding domain n=1 Tax=Geosmithia morbida TaxID=1094350 RepID=A0A9P5CYK7_9HYPO|nr:Chitin binding domain [Geosmithia morbida]KAF4120543.1 Chitin binding domain [Geosmithia morbida]